LSECIYICLVKASETSVKDQIIETASRLFFTQGYNLTGINQIIEEAGVAKASLYYHFPSKEDLCVEYLKKRYKIFWCGKLLEFLEGVEDGVERLTKVFECRMKYMEETNYGGCAYSRIISELPQRVSKINEQVKLQKNKQRVFFGEEVRRLKGISPSRLDEIADTIFLLFDGATSQAQLYQEVWPIENAIKAVKQLIKQEHT
jgi:AcrR family transcriptional regulator